MFSSTEARGAEPIRYALNFSFKAAGGMDSCSNGLRPTSSNDLGASRRDPIQNSNVRNFQQGCEFINSEIQRKEIAQQKVFTPGAAFNEFFVHITFYEPEASNERTPDAHEETKWRPIAELTFKNKNHWKYFSEGIRSYPCAFFDPISNDEGFLSNCIKGYFKYMGVSLESSSVGMYTKVFDESVARMNFDNSVDILKQNIAQLKVESDKLKESNPGNSRKVSTLSDNLQIALNIFETSYKAAPTREKVQMFKNAFDTLLQDDDIKKVVATKYPVARVIAHIVLGATIVGLFAIVAQLIHSKISTGQCNFFFKPRAEKLIENTNYQASRLIYNRFL